MKLSKIERRTKKTLSGKNIFYKIKVGYAALHLEAHLQIEAQNNYFHF